MQVLTVHSPIRLENHTSHPLSFILHPTSARDGLKPALDAAESRIPCHSPLAAGSQCYLPLTAMRCGSTVLLPWQSLCNTLHGQAAASRIQRWSVSRRVVKVMIS